MIRKVIRIVVDAVTSLIVFFVMVIIVDLVDGKILGSTKDASGAEKLNGGGATSITLLIISGAVAITFSIWFYRFLTNHKFTKVTE